MTHNFCTIASRDYAYNVLALYNSIKKHDPNFRFFVICFGEDVERLFRSLSLANASVVSIAQIELHDIRLKEIKGQRSEKEYAWTAKPSIFLYLFRSYPELNHLMWLDGDTAFLASPETIYNEWGNCSILLTEEMYSDKYEYMSAMYGVYNTGLMGFKNDAISIEALQWMRNKVLAWCYDRHEMGLWSDQMYVNDWPCRFRNVGVIKDRGINMTPFILKRLLNESPSTVTVEKGFIFVNDISLTLFHYYGFRYFNENEFDLCAYKNWGFPKEAIKHIYMKYADMCTEAIRQIKDADGSFHKLKSPDRNKCGYYYSETVFNFCTIATLEFLPKLLALYESVEKHVESFRLWILCMDESSYDMLERQRLLSARLIKLESVEDSELAAVKKSRKLYEYCWTLKAPLIKHIFENFEYVDSLLYVDSDTYLFSSPKSLFYPLSKYSVVLTHHNFSRPFRYLYREKGRYNAGIIGFRRDRYAMRCLSWWGKKCVEWCFDRIEKDRFADQRYLEEFENKIPGVYLAKDVSANSAIWNIGDFVVKKRGNSIYINNKELIFYHFSSFEILSEHEFNLWKWDYLKLKGELMSAIYLVYAEAVFRAVKALRLLNEDLSCCFSGREADERVFNYINMDDKKYRLKG